MKFLQKLFGWDAAVKPFERILHVFFSLVLIVGFITLMVTVLGYQNEFGQKAGAHHILFGWIFLGGAIFWGWWNFSERIPFKVNDVLAMIILFALLVISLNFFTAWEVFD